ncbi:CinA family protein [Nigerium massiliense]|uniref:CinA family protein n=1 Tax=Nigerium massiliense TaxID=1522317 RepID=UPI00058F58AF|nr:CinA family protein [Nigerium massiliense]
MTESKQSPDTATRLVKTLTSRDLKLCTAESLTGGLLGATITSVPGASAVYLGGFIAYDSTMKSTMLDVDENDIEAHTVVSGEVAAGMALGAQELTGADWSVAVTGVAGPTPQDGHEPGEVFISVIGPRTASMPPFALSERYELAGDRDAVRTQTVETALQMLLRAISPV